jgi:spore maturation protein CgeB
MITVVYSFNKKGYEADYWTREIAAASNKDVRFIPFNHDPYVPVDRYIRGQLLDNLYFEKNTGLRQLYRDIAQLIQQEKADALLVDNCPPYHPEFLRTLPIHKVLRTADGPMSSYDRDFVYVHAYDQVLCHSPAYSRDMSMREKLLYCGARNVDLWPAALFEAAHTPTLDEEAIFSGKRDIDIVFVGALHVNKMPLLAKVKKAFGRRFVLRGLASPKKNLYFNVRHGVAGWIKPLPFEDYVPMYRRAKIGLNVHNRGKYTVGGYRLFELPANGAMQISDGGEYLSTFFEPDREIVGYDTGDELIDHLRYYLAHDAEREEIARAGYRRVLRDHTIALRLHQAGEMICKGIAQARSGAVAR